MQQEHGECLTYEESLEHLRKEEGRKQNKKQKQTSKKRKKMVNNSKDNDVDENICYIYNKEDPPSNDKES